MQAQKSTVSTLVRVAAHCVLPPLVSHTCDLLATPELCTVTLDEYRIMQHKEGDLYNKSVLQGVAQAATQAQNIKRENKLYSYAEQMAEIKLQQVSVDQLLIYSILHLTLTTLIYFYMNHGDQCLS